MDNKLDFLAFGAHPDDVELGCSGAILKIQDSGKKVGVIDLTRGELGTRGSSKIRSKETELASKILGLNIRENLEFEDGFINNDKEHQLKVISVIRKYKPDFVFCNAPDDRHIDHPKASKLITDSCFLSGLSKLKTFDSSGNNQEKWRPKNIFHYIQWKNLKPDFILDITGYMNSKMKAIKCYSSQFYDPNSKELETPISKKNFLNFIESRSAEYGRIIGTEYGEGFIYNRIIGLGSLNDFI
jgi:bacillithiol biosynthesis deacetylase BshB1